MSEVRRVAWKDGRFRAKSIIVRQINNIEIVFYDSKSIYVRSEYGVWIVFHRWFAGSGSYIKGWKQFRHLLLYVDGVDFAYCHRKAFQLDIPSQVSKKPDLEGKTVEIITMIRKTRRK